jgi:hypothetical protein
LLVGFRKDKQKSTNATSKIIFSEFNKNDHAGFHRTGLVKKYQVNCFQFKAV